MYMGKALSFGLWMLASPHLFAIPIIEQRIWHITTANAILKDGHNFECKLSQIGTFLLHFPETGTEKKEAMNLISEKDTHTEGERETV